MYCLVLLSDFYCKENDKMSGAAYLIQTFFGDISWYQESKKPGELQESGILPKKFESSALLQERALIEGVAWPPQLDFWVRSGCYQDFAVYVGRTMRLRLEEEPLYLQLEIGL